MPIFKNQSKTSYAAIPNDTLRDKRLSIESRGVLAYLLTHTDTFNISFEFLQKELGVGRDKLKKIIHELKENGYLALVAAHSKKGTFNGQEWYVFAESQGKDFTVEQINRPTEKPSDGKTDGRLNRQTENTSDILKEKLREKKSLEEKKESLPANARRLVYELNENELDDSSVIEGLKARLKTPTVLPNMHRWLPAISNAHKNGYDASHFLETYDVLDELRRLRDKSYKITPEMVESDVGNLVERKLELKKLQNGTGNSKTSANGSAKSQERLDRIIEDSKRFESPGAI